MPNWCSNSFTVKGHPRRVIEFIHQTFDFLYEKNLEAILDVDAYTLSFSKFDPTPKDDKGQIIKDWYFWRSEHWGTKWDPCVMAQRLTFTLKTGETVIIRDWDFSPTYLDDTVDSMDVTKPAILEISFNTAWAPPERYYERITGTHEGDDLEFEYRYYESGCAFAGEKRIKNAVIEHEYHIESDDFREYCKYLLDEGFEDVEYIMDQIYEVYKETHGHLGLEPVRKLYNATEKAIMSLDENLKHDAIATLYAWLMRK